MYTKQNMSIILRIKGDCFMEGRRRAAAKQMITDSFLLILEQKPINKITVTQVCDNADVSRATFYANYTDIYDLLEQTENDFQTKVTESVLSLGSSGINRFLFRNVLNEFDKNRRLCRALLGEYGDKGFLDRCCTLYGQKIVDDWKLRFPDADITKLKMMGTFVIRGAFGLIEEWAKNDFAESSESVADLISDFYLSVIERLDKELA